MLKIKKAIIPVAGLGTRFLPATKAMPKEMLPLVDKPVIQFLVEEAVQSGITEIIFVTGRGKRAIEDHFDYMYELEQVLTSKGQRELAKTVREISNMAKFTYVRQKEQRGDGDALLSAAHLIGNEPVAVLFGDDIIVGKTPALSQLISVYDKYTDPVVALQKVNPRDVSQYGIIAGTDIGSRTYEVTRVVEKPKQEDAPSNLAIIGKYIITPEVFAALRKIDGKKGGELRLADALQHYLQKKPVYGVELEGRRFDCGSKIGFLEATVHFGLNHPETGELFKNHIKAIAQDLK